MSEKNFADAGSSYDDSDFVVLGIEFDATSSFVNGSAMAPKSIREMSYNFEEYQMEYDLDLRDLKVHDAGDMEELGIDAEQAVNAISERAGRFWKDSKIPIFLGGEHTATVGALRPLAGKDNVGIIIVDAHLDYREDYMDDPYSHACVTRRLTELFGRDSVICLGIRSISGDEVKEKDLPKYYSSYDIYQKGIPTIIDEAMHLLGKERIYLSIDMDGLDPAFAPGVGNPEPFGLSPLDIKVIIDTIAPRAIGMDIVEVCPPRDNGNTSALAARLVRMFIASHAAERLVPE